MLKSGAFCHQHSWLGLAIVLVVGNFFVISVESYSECPESNFSGLVRFYLYSRSIPDRIELIPDNTTSLEESGLNTTTLTKFITHGFMENPGFCNSTKYIIDEFKNFTDFNMILIDWSALSGRLVLDYSQVVVCVRSGIAEYLGSFVNFLAKHGVSRESIHLIGHSLGAQIIGIAANYIDFVVPRITALDPSGPLFDHLTPPTQKLDSKDALVVDVIHTNAILGTYGSDGTLDFYVNGGTLQPGCEQPPGGALVNCSSLICKLEELIENQCKLITTYRCDHQVSYRLFARSINPANEFPSLRCCSVEAARSRPPKCHGGHGYAGYHLRDTKPGVYYTNTSGYDFGNMVTEQTSSCTGLGTR